MFLSDKLEEIQRMDISSAEKRKLIVKELFSRIPKPEVGVAKFLDELKCIDNSYQYFCKKYSDYNPIGFRTILLKDIPEADAEKLKTALNW